MGHSNITLSLTYLRGLEKAVLKEEDMPTVQDCGISLVELMKLREQLYLQVFLTKILIGSLAQLGI